jgi:DNA-binding transcriptional ArsR family regulator
LTRLFINVKKISENCLSILDTITLCEIKMENTHKEKESVLKALSNSTRREIMRQIVAKSGATYTQMMEILGLDPSLKSGRFNYHLKELVDAGLIYQIEGVYKISELGEKALILIDQVSKESKIDRYGVLYAAISMNPREELGLFKSQFAIGPGFVIVILGIILSLISQTNQILDLIVSASFIIVGSLLLGYALWNLGGFVRRYGLGLSSLLLIDSSWFLIRSPNRGKFILMMLFGMIGIFSSLVFFVLFYTTTISVISLGGFVLLLIMSFSWLLFIIFMMKTTRNIEKLEGVENE